MSLSGITESHDVGDKAVCQSVLLAMGVVVHLKEAAEEQWLIVIHRQPSLYKSGCTHQFPSPVLAGEIVRNQGRSIRAA
jgi:hypothetical protein